MNTRVSTVLNTKQLVTLYVVDCAQCGVIFGVPNDFDNRRRDDGRSFYCPNGHSVSYRESEADKQKKRADDLDRRLKSAWKHIAEQDQELTTKDRQIAARKGQVTKLRNAARNGQCPCCGKVFVHLERHMAKQHPEFTDEAGEE